MLTVVELTSKLRFILHATSSLYLISYSYIQCLATVYHMHVIYLNGQNKSFDSLYGYSYSIQLHHEHIHPYNSLKNTDRCNSPISNIQLASVVQLIYSYSTVTGKVLNGCVFRRYIATYIEIKLMHAGRIKNSSRMETCSTTWPTTVSMEMENLLKGVT